MSILFIQTTDSNYYYEMLQQASRTVRNYCLSRGVFYEQYVGEKRNNMPWKAAYNRIRMLQDLLKENFSGWVLYMDADSYIKDQNFDIFQYFSDKKRYAGIFSGYLNNVPYNINSGGFAINFDHPLGRQIVQDYVREYEKVSQSALDNALTWEKDVAEDQFMLHSVLRRYVDEYGLGDKLLFERADHSYVNNGPFISQVLRIFGSVHKRTARIREIADQTLPETVPEDIRTDTVLNLHTSHPRIATIEHGRRFSLVHADKDFKGRILWGPYITLTAGSYEFIIYVYVSGPVDQKGATITLDVTGESGNVTFSRQDFRITSNGPQTFRVPFILKNDAQNLETRAELKGGAEVYFSRIQILRDTLSIY